MTLVNNASNEADADHLATGWRLDKYNKCCPSQHVLHWLLMASYWRHIGVILVSYLCLICSHLVQTYGASIDLSLAPNGVILASYWRHFCVILVSYWCLICSHLVQTYGASIDWVASGLVVCSTRSCSCHFRWCNQSLASISDPAGSSQESPTSTDSSCLSHGGGGSGNFEDPEGSPTVLEKERIPQES